MARMVGGCGGISRLLLLLLPLLVVVFGSGSERSVQAEVEADGLEDEALDADQVRSMCLLCLCVRAGARVSCGVPFPAREDEN